MHGSRVMDETRRTAGNTTTASRLIQSQHYPRQIMENQHHQNLQPYYQQQHYQKQQHYHDQQHHHHHRFEQSQQHGSFINPAYRSANQWSHQDLRPNQTYSNRTNQTYSNSSSSYPTNQYYNHHSDVNYWTSGNTKHERKSSYFNPSPQYEDPRYQQNQVDHYTKKSPQPNYDLPPTPDNPPTPNYSTQYYPDRQIQTIPSEHYPPTPYSSGSIHSPNSEVTSSDYLSRQGSQNGCPLDSGYSPGDLDSSPSPNQPDLLATSNDLSSDEDEGRSDGYPSGGIDDIVCPDNIPLHELIGSVLSSESSSANDANKKDGNANSEVKKSSEEINEEVATPLYRRLAAQTSPHPKKRRLSAKKVLSSFQRKAPTATYDCDLLSAEMESALEDMGKVLGEGKPGYPLDRLQNAESKMVRLEFDEALGRNENGERQVEKLLKPRQSESSEDEEGIEFPFKLAVLGKQLADEINTVVSREMGKDFFFLGEKGKEGLRLKIDIMTSLVEGGEEKKNNRGRKRCHQETLVLPLRRENPGKRFKSGEEEKKDAVTKSLDQVMKQTETPGDQFSSCKVASFYRYQCSECLHEFPLRSDTLDAICDHVAVGPHRPTPKLCSIFKYLKPKVKLIVSTSGIVTTTTVYECLECSTEIHGGHKSVSKLVGHIMKHSDIGDFCPVCDRRVANLEDHVKDADNDRWHRQRLESMQACGCGERKEKDLSKFCSFCQKKFGPETALPRWMSGSSCLSCFSGIVEQINKSKKKKKVVLCDFCRQGKYGYKTNLGKNNNATSVCSDCFDRFDAFLTLMNGQECRSYVRGMLNELMSRLPSQQKPSPRKQIAVVKPAPISRRINQDDLFNIAQSVFPNLQHASLLVVDEVVASGPDPMAVLRRDKVATLKCTGCSEEWQSINKQNLESFLEHRTLNRFSPGRTPFASEILEEKRALLVCDNEEKGMSMVFVEALLRCKHCKSFCWPQNSQQILGHVEKCGGEIKNHQVCLVCGKKSGKRPHSLAGNSCLKHLSSQLQTSCLKKRKKTCKICRNSVSDNNSIPTKSSVICDPCFSLCLSTAPKSISTHNLRDCVVCDVRLASTAESVTFVRGEVTYDVSFCRSCHADLRSGVMRRHAENSGVIGELVRALGKTFC